MFFVLFRAPVYYRGPFTSLKRFETTFKSTKFIGGAGDMYSSGAEGLAMALNVFDKLDSKREKVQEVSLETSRFVIYIANSAPYELPVEFVPKYVSFLHKFENPNPTLKKDKNRTRGQPRLFETRYITTFKESNKK